MKRQIVLTVIFLVSLAMAASAGTLHGTVAAANQNAAVYVDPIPGKTFPTSNVPYQIDQQNMQFQPHVVVVPVGATVTFKNDDALMHNVFWPSIDGNKKLSHNLGTWAQGQTRSFKFDHPGVVPLLCNVHPEMSGYIIVVPTSYYSQTNGAGEYTIRNIPDGHYTVSAWREGKRIETKQVTVNGDTKFNF